MAKRQRHRRRTMKGGFLENVSNTLSNWGTSVSQSATDLWQKTKQATSNITGSTSTSYTPTQTTTYTPPVTTSTYGGKTKRRRMRGGFTDNTPTTGLATHAAPFSGPTAQPQTIVGGKTRRHKRRGHRSRRYRRH